MKTKSDRRKVYVMAAELIDEDTHLCCWAIEKVLFGTIGLQPAAALFYSPELNLFKPDNINVIWWNIDDLESRIIALLLCAEMCKQ